VLDVNVIVAALLSRRGVPARLLTAWLDGAFEMVTSPRLLAELDRALSYAKLRDRLRPDDASELVALLRSSGTVVDDPVALPPIGSRDPNDDYLIALAARTRSILVTGDADLLALAGRIPVMAPRAFFDRLEREA
jgi:putative PIN family toxin of toxin-antitoxin system